ncbi:MAG: hypothetical protein ACHBMF_06815 [Chromatiales bacterium]
MKPPSEGVRIAQGSVQENVVDESGAALSTSSTVTFHLKKHAVLLGN